MRKPLLQRTATCHQLRRPEQNRTAGAKTVLQEVIEAEVSRALRKDLEGAVKGAREEVLAAVRDQAATVISETIARTARA